MMSNDAPRRAHSVVTAAALLLPPIIAASIYFGPLGSGSLSNLDEAAVPVAIILAATALVAVVTYYRLMKTPDAAAYRGRIRRAASFWLLLGPLVSFFVAITRGASLGAFIVQAAVLVTFLVTAKSLITGRT